MVLGGRPALQNDPAILVPRRCNRSCVYPHGSDGRGRFPLSLRNVEDQLHERRIEISHEIVRFWWSRLRRAEALVTDRLSSCHA